MKAYDIKSDEVLCISCAEEHLIEIDHQTFQFNGKPPLKNAILETVMNELHIDHHYLPQTRTILVKVNYETLDNPILRDW